MSREKVLSLAEGRVFTGEMARENGLVDELGGLEKAISIAKNISGLPEASKVQIYPKKILQRTNGRNSWHNYTSSSW